MEEVEEQLRRPSAGGLSRLEIGFLIGSIHQFCTVAVSSLASVWLCGM